MSQGFGSPQIIEDHEEIFEILDFSISSQFEKFVSEVEKRILFIIKGKDSKPEFINFFGLDLQINHVRGSERSVIDDILDTKFDFDPKCSPITRDFGLEEYIVVLPCNQSEISEDKANKILSGLCISFQNLKEEIPFFVCIGSQKDGVFLGRHYFSSKVIKFRTENLQEIPPMCADLGGLLDLFMINIQKSNPSQTLERAVDVSARFKYEIPSKALKWRKSLRFANKNLPKHLLPFGSVRDPIESVHISTQWSKKQEKELDNRIALVPQTLNSWRVKCLPEVHNEMKLGNFLKSMKSVFKEVMSAGPVASDTVGMESGKELDEDELLLVSESMEKIFQFRVSPPEDEEMKKNMVKEKEVGFKTFPIGSLLSLVTVQACYFDEVRMLRQFWRQFLSTLRIHWRKRTPIPNVPNDQLPQWGHSLLHQKLVMLNFCIARISELNLQDNIVDDDDFSASDISDSGEESGDDEDEFFDVKSDGKFTDPLAGMREGAEKPLEGVKMEKTGNPIYIPKTRPYAFLHTWDQVQESQKEVSGMSTSKERAEYHSKSLFSDMQAFKAANPGCSFVDFVQWFSKNDIIDGKLSQRMQMHSLWHKLWEEAKEMSVEKQPPLFDYYKEGDLIIKYFRELDFRMVAKDLLLHSFLLGYFSLFVCSPNDMIPLTNKLEELENFLKDLFRGKAGDMPKLMKLFEEVENLTSIAVSLSEKFNGSKKIGRLFSKLVDNKFEAIIQDESEKLEIMNVLKKGEKQWIKPNTREYLLREKCGHRMSVCFELKRNYKIATAFLFPFP